MCFSRVLTPQGLSPVISRPDLEVLGSIRGQAIFFFSAKNGADTIQYWSPRDPRRVRSIDIGDWRRIGGDGDVLLFASITDATQRLLWRWGSATAVRIPFDRTAQMVACGGTAFALSVTGGERALYEVPLPYEPTEDGLPPPVLPAAGAPLLPGRLLFRTCRPVLMNQAACVDDQPPLLVYHADRTVNEYYALCTRR